MGIKFNYNDFIEPKHISFGEGTILNTRAKLDTGKFCNARCQWCYYLDQTPDYHHQLRLKDARPQIDFLIEEGIKEIELSGGEPTLIKDFIPICTYLKSKGLKTSIVTNGQLGMTQSGLKKLEKAYKNGLNEVLISVHGFEVDHDQEVGVNGAFRGIVNFIEKAKELGIKIRLNVVVTHNQKLEKMLPWLETHLKNESIEQLNFLPLNYWEHAKNFKLPDNSLFKVYSSLNKGIEYLYDKVPNSLLRSQTGKPEWKITIRYPQWCLLDENARMFARGHFHHCIDITDWNKIYYPNDDFLVDQYFGVKGYGIGRGQELPTSPDSKEDNKVQAIKDRKVSHFKDKHCSECKYFYLCDGIKHQDKDFWDEVGDVVRQSKKHYFLDTNEEFQSNYLNTISNFRGDQRG